eukprot:1463308-Alexandrium_andersonii.AAC.1
MTSSETTSRLTKQPKHPRTASATTDNRFGDASETAQCSPGFRQFAHTLLGAHVRICFST